MVKVVGVWGNKYGDRDGDGVWWGLWGWFDGCLSLGLMEMVIMIMFGDGGRW